MRDGEVPVRRTSRWYGYLSGGACFARALDGVVRPAEDGVGRDGVVKE